MKIWDALTCCSIKESLVDSLLHNKKKVEAFQVEFRVIKFLLTRFHHHHPHFMILTDIVSSIEKELGGIDLLAENWNSLAAPLNHKIQELKALITNGYDGRVVWGKFSTLDKILEYFDVLRCYMNNGVVAVDEFASVKRSHIKILKEILFLQRYFIAFTPMSGEQKYETALYFDVRSWVGNAEHIILLSWRNGKTLEKTAGLYLNCLHNDPITQRTPELIRLCFGLIKVLELQRSDALIFGEFFSMFVDFFLENVVFTLKDTDVLVLREGLLLLITFLVDPPTNTMDHSLLSSIQKRIHAVFYQAERTIKKAKGIYAFYDQAEGTIKKARKTIDIHFVGKITIVHLKKSVKKVRGEIEGFYIAYPSWSDFPRINGLGHFESLLVYLEILKETMGKNKKAVPFIKHQVITIKKELMLLKLLLQDIWKMQNDDEEVKGMCDQIIRLSYQTDLAIKSFFLIDHSLWYNLTTLSFIVEKIKDIKNKVMKIKDSHIKRIDHPVCYNLSNMSFTVEKIKDIRNKVMTIKENHIYRTKVDPPLMNSVDVFKTPTSPTSTSTSTVEVVVGFKQDTEVLIDRLTRGTAKLDIVPIVGMGGIGKTTLAKKLFNETSIRYHFHKRAFCRMSQEYRKRNVLLGILSDLCTIDDEVRQKSDDDLAHMVWKRLSGCKYLIVLDDIWDIKDWYDVRNSFPNDNNGSRVIFTTRISNIYLTENCVSNCHSLSFLSVDESWELLRRKIFHDEPCPPHLCELGKLNAKKCGGLPLAIVVIAGLLTRTERSLSEWNKITDDLTTFASSEGCKEVIRLSYNRLPEPLKSCFLYLGIFHEDEKIKAKMLTKLWVAEGFVLKSENNLCLRNVAKQYLDQLGDINLVTVTKRSCNGRIKHFQVHDLIRDFCRTEAEEQHYLCFVNSQNIKLSMPIVCDQYRVCIEDEWISFIDSKTRGATVHTLLHYSKDYCLANSLESVLCNFKLVQVLDLQMQVEVDGGFPTAVTSLVHLRYLALRLHMFGIEKVPSEISNLWNLETLLILGIKVQFPCDIWKMKRLRHVETDDEAHVALDYDDVSGLPDLESFISLVIPPGKYGEELLRRLPNVRKLCCLFSGYSCLQIPKLEILTNLESLQIRYIGEGYFRYPYTFTFSLTIRKLILERFELHWNEFTAVIQKLPNLQVLVLRWTKSYDDAKIWDVEDEEFPNIKSLTLEDSDIEEWKASTDSFPCMEKLKLSYCKDLIQVPPCFGDIPTLKNVVVRYCNKGVEDSALQIQQDSDDQINLEVMTHNINL